MTSVSVPGQTASWRTPLVIIVCGCAIAMLTFGPRSALGQFLTPMSLTYGWGREVFSLAIAIQNLLWGLGQPFAGAIADRFGTIRVLCGGALLYAAGLALMAYSSTPGALHLSAGMLIGFGLSGCSFNLVIGAFGKLVPERMRGLAFGAGTAAGSFGQFLFSPVARALIDQFDWHVAVLVFAAGMLLILPLSLALRTPRAESGGASGIANQSLTQALSEAFGHRSYVLLVLGFFTCGFQLAFVTVHLPSFLVDRGLSNEVGAWTIGVIGLFNVIGSLTSGWLMSRMPKRYILSIIYFLRAVSIVAFITLPMSPLSALIFGAVTGLLWLSTVPPTSGLVAVMFGTRWLAMLFGFAFFSHQVGGFLGVLLGGIAFEATGSYDLVWWLSVFFGVASAVINLPIIEKPVLRPALNPV
ncbi:MAG: MFS transporter [Pseudorhodoplanes sp.]|jgi:MFS family permease|nr:MFS transporter [Pseudorhodoplanes sp.]